MLKKIVSCITLILLLGCANEEAQREKIVGVWEKVIVGDADTFSICVQYEKDGHMFLTTFTESPQKTEEFERPRIGRYEGSWKIRDGGRLSHLVVPLGMLGVRDQKGKLPMSRTQIHLIKKLTDETITYRHQSRSNSWETYERVEKCSSKFEETVVGGGDSFSE